MYPTLAVVFACGRWEVRWANRIQFYSEERKEVMLYAKGMMAMLDYLGMSYTWMAEHVRA